MLSDFSPAIRSSIRTGDASAPGASRTTTAGRAGSGIGRGNTFGRTVAICGRASGQVIVASRFPPNAGRVCKSSPVPGSMSSRVQSAVSPVRSFAAARGAKLRPNAVAPISTISGAYFRISRASSAAWRSSSGGSSSPPSTSSTLSAPDAASSSAYFSTSFPISTAVASPPSRFASPINSWLTPRTPASDHSQNTQMPPITRALRPSALRAIRPRRTGTGRPRAARGVRFSRRASSSREARSPPGRRRCLRRSTRPPRRASP